MAARKPTAKSAAKANDTAADDAAALTNAFTDAARGQYETALQALSESADKFRTQTEDAFISARDGFEAASERMRAVSAETMTAVREEMADAVAFANDLARAKSMSDALEIQRGYWTKLFNARIERMRAFADVSTEAARDAIEPLSRTYASAFAFAPTIERFFPFSAR
jgi:hypothetical protein